MYIRPETLTLLYLAIDLAILVRWERFPALAVLLPVVQVAWVNSQGLFVLGPILLTFALVDALLRPGSLAPGRRRWWRIAGVATLLTGLACLVNPYGLTGALYPLELARTMGNPIFARTIAELTPIPLFIRRSAGLHSLPLGLHIATMILGALSFLVPLIWMVTLRFRGPSAGPAADDGRPGRPSKARDRDKTKASKRAKKSAGPDGEPSEPAWRLSPFRLLLFAAFSFLSWQATRNSHQFAAVVGAITAWNFGEWAAALRPCPTAAETSKRPPSPGRAAGIVPRLVTLAAIAFLVVLVAGGKFYAMSAEGRTVGLGEEPLWFPHAAVRFAGREEMPRRFLSFHDGYSALYDYYHGPGRKVFVDARLEVIGPEMYLAYNELQRLILEDNPAWTRELDNLDRPAILVGHAQNAVLGASILSNSNWRCVWFDPIVAVYVHRSYTGAVSAHRVDLAARHFAPDPETEPRGLAALQVTAEALWKYASTLQGRGRADLARPLVLLGLDYARRIRQADPESLDGWKLIGKLESTREQSAMGPQSPRSPRFRLPFDPVFDLSNVRATYAYRRALEIAPDDFLSLYLLMNQFEERGMDEAAGPLLGRLARIVPINPEQASMVRGAGAQAEQVRALLGPPAPATWQNLSQLEETVEALLLHGRARSAAEFLERAYPKEPRPWEVTDRLATLWLHLGEPARARSLWGAAVSPPRPDVRAARLAVTHLVEGQFDTARRPYREALATAPDLYEARYGLAVLEQDVGHAAQALSEARESLAAAPGDVARSAAQAILTLARPYAGEASAPSRPSPDRSGHDPERKTTPRRPDEPDSVFR
jgi:hypothetical protein